MGTQRVEKKKTLQSESGASRGATPAGPRPTSLTRINSDSQQQATFWRSGSNEALLFIDMQSFPFLFLHVTGCSVVHWASNSTPSLSDIVHSFRGIPYVLVGFEGFDQRDGVEAILSWGLSPFPYSSAQQISGSSVLKFRFSLFHTIF